MEPELLSKVLIENEEGRYLILRRSEWPENPQRSLEPDLPGGEVENDETPLDVAIREVDEETGIKLNEDELSKLTILRHKQYNKDITRYIYVAKVKNPNIRLSWEHDKYWWMTKVELRALEIREPYSSLFKQL